MNLLNKENQNLLLAEDRTLRELKDLLSSITGGLKLTRDSEAPVYFARFEEPVLIALN